MAIAEFSKTLARPTSKFKFALHFSERKLLLFLGDAFVLAIAGSAAVWLHSFIK